MASKIILSMLFSIIFIFSNVLAVPTDHIVDMPNGWSEPAVTEAIQNCVLRVENNLIRPMEELTRAEMAEGIANVFGATEKGDLSSYIDVPDTKDYYEAMQRAVAMGIISGYGNGLIKPEKKITREEMFTVIYNALELEEGNVQLLDNFNDRNLVSEWAEKIVARMVQNGYVAGNVKGNIKSTESITREEFAQVIKNIFSGYYREPGIYTSLPIGNIIVSSENVTLKDSIITGDLIIADGVDTGEVVLDNVTVLGRTLIRGGGESAIKLINNTSLNGKVIVNNNIGKVRIYNSKSKVNNVEIKTPVILEGNFESVNIKKATEIEIKGNIKRVIVEETTKVAVASGTVEQVYVNSAANKTEIAGKGKVTQVNVNANDVLVTTSKTKVTAGNNTTGVMAGKVEVKPGKVETVNSTSRYGGGASLTSTVGIVYNENGGEGIPSTQICEATDYVFTVSATIPTKEGYKFLGWADSPDAKSAIYTMGNKIIVNNEIKTIYAIWGCMACSEVECTKTHVYCNICKKYDCNTDHSLLTLSAASSWYKGETKKDVITKISIVDRYFPSGKETESWNADIYSSGSIKCYILENQLIIAGNGNGEIYANEDSSFLFSDVDSTNRFKNVIAIDGLSLINTCNAIDMTQMFAGCSSLQILDISSFDMCNVKNLEAMLWGLNEFAIINVGDDAHIVDGKIEFIKEINDNVVSANIIWYDFEDMI